MNKAYSPINWENYPSIKTPINDSNLNKLDVATNEIDNRVITLDTGKANLTDISTLIADASYNEATGVITLTRKNGGTVTFDTKLEKLAVNFAYDAATEQLVITLDDGTAQYVNMSALITQYEFLDSDTIAFSIDADGKVTAIVKDGSIEEKHLNPDYLAAIKVESATATKKASEAEASAVLAESYAHGGTSSRYGEDSDNAKYYSEKSQTNRNESQAYAEQAQAASDEVVNRINEAIEQNVPQFVVDFTTGHLMYQGGSFAFSVLSNGHLGWEVSA